MPSRFPGMDPYLERRRTWRDFHQQFCGECRRQVTQQLGQQWFAVLVAVSNRATESYIEIRDRDSPKLVTVIEVLSPSN